MTLQVVDLIVTVFSRGSEDSEISVASRLSYRSWLAPSSKKMERHLLFADEDADGIQDGNDIAKKKNPPQKAD